MKEVHCVTFMPLSSHTARVSAGGGTLSVSQPEGGKEHCGPVPTDTLDATAADRASGLDSTSQTLPRRMVYAASGAMMSN